MQKTSKRAKNVFRQHQHLLIFQLAPIVPILNLVTLSLLKDKELANQTCLTVNQLKMKKKTIVSIKKHHKEAREKREKHIS
jgi:hypothetical protein